jgi:hypothetical protein
MEAAFEWTELEGWRPTHKLKLHILQLEHSISGTNIPVPKTLLKYLLNLMLPALIEARLLAVLPAEIGQYFIDTDTPGVQLGGKMHVFGPSLTALNADLAADPSAPPPAGALLRLQPWRMLRQWVIAMTLNDAYAVPPAYECECQIRCRIQHKQGQESALGSCCWSCSS